MGNGIGGHQTTKGKNDEWITPPEIIQALGEFDLDPCSAINQPWDTANNYYTIDDDGLLMPWFGRVWLNPPYNRYLIPMWMEKMAMHKNGTALVFARTETEWFQRFVFPHCQSILFIDGRLHFHYIDGARAKANAGAPSVLIAYDEFDSDMIEKSGIKGKHLSMNPELFTFGLFSSGTDKTWRVVVGESLEEIGRDASVSEIYKTVMRLSPGKAGANNHYKEKIRQTLQRYFTKVSHGTYTA